MSSATEALYKAVALHQAGELAAAQALYRAVLILEPHLADAARLSSVLHRQAGDAESAWRWALRAMRLSPADAGAVEALKSAAVALLAMLERNGAILTETSLDPYDALAQLAPDNPGVVANRQAIVHNLLMRAMDRHRSGDLAEAERLYRRVLHSVPGDADTLFLIAQIERRRGDAAAAIKALTKAMAGPINIGRRELLNEIVVEALARDRAAPDPVKMVNRTLEALFNTSLAAAPPPAFLTIAIPTWNRRDRLELCLRSLIEQINQLGHRDVRILVSDNGSNDGTQEMLQDLASRHPMVILRPNIANIGFEWNVMKLAWLTAWALPSTFTWLHGDDDQTRPGGVALILKALERAPADYMTFSTSLNRGAALRRSGDVDGIELRRGGLMDLCEALGLIATLGAVSRVIFQPAKLRDARWERHLNSFAHATLLLDQLFDSDACVINADLQFSNSDGAETTARWMQEGAYVRLLRVADALRGVLDDHRRGGVVAEGFWAGTTRGYLGETLHVVESLIKDVWMDDLTPERRHLLSEGYLPRIKALLDMTKPGDVRQAAHERYERLLQRIASPQ